MFFSKNIKNTFNILFITTNTLDIAFLVPDGLIQSLWTLWTPSRTTQEREKKPLEG